MQEASGEEELVDRQVWRNKFRSVPRRCLERPKLCWTRIARRIRVLSRDFTVEISPTAVVRVRSVKLTSGFNFWIASNRVTRLFPVTSREDQAWERQGEKVPSWRNWKDRKVKTRLPAFFASLQFSGSYVTRFVWDKILQWLPVCKGYYRWVGNQICVIVF